MKRPAVIARIRTAKEHGDLKENADYHAAREEQSFLEGRIQAHRGATPDGGHRRRPGRRLAGRSRLGGHRRDDDGETATYTIVGAVGIGPGDGPDLVVVAGRVAPWSAATRATTSSSRRRPDDRRYRIVSIG